MARRHDHLRLGAHGEGLVARRYELDGYRVLARNWRCPVGELDLVLARGALVVVCEVKTRSSARFGSGLEAVDRAKQRRLRRLAALWVATEAPFRPESVRIDVAAVTGGRVEVVHGAC